jgi:hypothetical protein
MWCSAEPSGSEYSIFAILTIRDHQPAGFKSAVSPRLSGQGLKRGFSSLVDDRDYARSTAMDFDRLLSRTCSVVNSRPQTLQRQPGEEIPAIPVAC